MTKYSKKEIADFQKLYLRYYGKNLTLEETEKRFDALVRLLRLVRDVPIKKKESDIKMKFNIKDKPTQ
jgi:cytochrome c-type biogenesis protein CcmE